MQQSGMNAENWYNNSTPPPLPSPPPPPPPHTHKKKENTHAHTSNKWVAYNNQKAVYE